MGSIDHAILKKMDYGARSKQKVIGKLRQKNADNKNILTINPQVLASSFQYLSYKELCCIIPTCSYFVYLNQSYPALSHYHIVIDKSFLIKAITNQINLDNLVHFSSISITYGYQGERSWDKDMERRTKLFRHIIKKTFRQSVNCRVLTIDVKKAPGGSWRSPMLLKFILNNADFPNLSTVNWIEDQMGSHRNDMLWIAENLNKKWPNLLNIKFGLDNYTDWTGSTALSESLILKALDSILSFKLVSLDLQCPQRFLFSKETKLIERLSTLKSLRKLTLCSLIADSIHPYLPKFGFANTSVEELSVRLVVRDLEGIKHSVVVAGKIVARLMCTFYGVKHLEIYGIAYSKANWSNDFLVPAAVRETFNWNPIFNILFRRKNDHSVKIGEIGALQSVAFKQMSKEQVVDAMNVVSSKRHEASCDIKRAAFDVVFPRFGVRSHYGPDFGYNDFTKKLILFLKCNNLEHIQLRYGGRFEYYMS